MLAAVDRVLVIKCFAVALLAVLALTITAGIALATPAHAMSVVTEGSWESEATVVTARLSNSPADTAVLTVASTTSAGSGAAPILVSAVVLAAGAYAIGRWQHDQRVAALNHAETALRPGRATDGAADERALSPA